jgi:hypothetical protein
VVEGAAHQAKQSSQQVAAHTVYFIRFAELHQVTVMTERALAPALESSQDRPIEVQIGAAFGAME